MGGGVIVNIFSGGGIEKCMFGRLKFFGGCWYFFGRGQNFWDGFENFRVGLTFFREGLRFCMVEKFQGVREFF